MENLSTDYKDDILDTEINTKRRYRMTTNADGTVSFTDETSYAQTGTQYGAKDVNEERTVINELLQSAASLKTYVDLKLDELKTYVDSKLDELKTTMKNEMFPVGTIIKTVRNVNPSTYLEGTWVAWGTGRVPVGVDTSQTEFNAVEKRGGSKTHTLTVNEIPSHKHSYTSGDIYVGSGNTEDGSFYGGDVHLVNGDTTGSAGGGKAHNNLQPYITCYMWKRTA